MAPLRRRIAVSCVVALATSLLLPAAGLVGASAAGAPAELQVPAKYLNQQVPWHPCYDPALLDFYELNFWPYTGLQCAKVKAPVDWNNPGSGTDIDLEMSRLLPQSGAVPSRVLISNPGGPGGSGITMPLAFGLHQPQLTDTFQLIGFDPRGTTNSSNVTCQGAPTAVGDPRDRDRAHLDLAANASKLVGQYCHVMTGDYINDVNTEQTVKDIDFMRQLVGAPSKIDWVGYSGGTWMGAYYATYFPQHTGRFVLDSNADFTSTWDQTFLRQPMSFERRFRQDWAPWVAQYHDFIRDFAASFGYPRTDLGSTADQVIAFYEKTRAEYKSQPLPFFGSIIDENNVDGYITQAMYSKTNFFDLATTFIVLQYLHDRIYPPSSASGTASRAAELPALIDKLPRIKSLLTHRRAGLTISPDSEGATFYAITCNDTAWAGGRGTAEKVSGDLGQQYPLLGWSQNFNPCWDWARQPLHMPTPTGQGGPPVLMVQSTHDPATAFEGAVDAHQHFAGSVMVTVQNEGDHGIYAFNNDCVNTIVNRFLVNGDLPAGDTTCQGTGIPSAQEFAQKEYPTSSTSGTSAEVNPLAALKSATSLTEFAGIAAEIPTGH
jgi:pimeloyl-ACP methyl ester carboxylesterase